MVQHPSELVMLEKSLSDIVLSEHRDIWALSNPSRTLSEAEHPLERREFTIYRPIGRPGGLSGDHVAGDLVCRDVQGLN
jgi:hypothetical protein